MDNRGHIGSKIDCGGFVVNLVSPKLDGILLRVFEEGLQFS